MANGSNITNTITVQLDLSSADVKEGVRALVREELAFQLAELSRAITRADTDATPPRVVDRDGDVWRRQEDGSYSCGGYMPRSLESLRDNYGPLTV